MQPRNRAAVGLTLKAGVGQTSSNPDNEKGIRAPASRPAAIDNLPFKETCFGFLQKVTEKLHAPCLNQTDMSEGKTTTRTSVGLADVGSRHGPDLSGGNPNPNELARKLKDLSLLNCPPKILQHPYEPSSDDGKETNGDGQKINPNSGYSLSVISPSPRQDEKRRAELQHETVTDIAQHYRRILEDIGEDITRQGLKKTPERAAKALLYFTKGYDEKISGTIYIYIYISTRGLGVNWVQRRSLGFCCDAIVGRA